MRAMSRGEAVRAVMSQVPAVSCIQVPREEMVDAIQRSRNSGMWRGPKPEGERVGVTACSAGPVLGVSNGILIHFTGFIAGVGRLTAWKAEICARDCAK
jgi:hypothetical protein